MAQQAKDVGDEHLKLGGIANYLRCQIEKIGCEAQVRTTILGHVQRGGSPIAFDRILATAMGVKAFELMDSGDFGKMVTYKNNEIGSVAITEAISRYNFLSPAHYLVRTARSLGVSFGDWM